MNEPRNLMVENSLIANLELFEDEFIKTNPDPLLAKDPSEQKLEAPMVDKSSSELAIGIANRLMNRGEYFLASMSLSKELSKNPFEPDLLFHLTMVFFRSKAFGKASQVVNELLKQETSFRSFKLKGDILYAQGETDLALNFFLDCVLVWENDSHPEELFLVYKTIGNIYIGLGDYEAAQDFYHKAHSINPISVELLVNYGTLYIQRQDESSALEKFRQAIKIDPQYAKAWIGLALIYLHLGDYALAKANLLTAIEKEPHNKTALSLMVHLAHKEADGTWVECYLTDYLYQCDFDFEVSRWLIEIFILDKKFDLAALELIRAQGFEPENESLEPLNAFLRKQTFNLKKKG